jgi:small subunit ribosomal protein S9
MDSESKIISYGIGRRKQAIAQVILKIGNGKLTINSKIGNTYLQDKMNYIQKINIPLILLGFENMYDIYVKTNGGGLTGQTEAIRLGIARALLKLNIKNRQTLKKAGLLTCDSRVKERKKYGLKKARKASQFSKR